MLQIGELAVYLELAKGVATLLGCLCLYALEGSDLPFSVEGKIYVPTTARTKEWGKQ